jgi:DNA-binding LytR/AlgR family response regulator
MIKCIAIDDESLALKQLSAYIEKTPYLQLVGKFDNAIETIGFLQNNKVDLMFVDIEMPELNGMEFVKSLNNPPKVIFITAYSQYAVEGFKVNAVDYLLKPVGYADFLKSAEKANALFNEAVTSEKKKRKKPCL